MKTSERLQLIPKCEKYIEYMIECIIKLPRTEKFSIGNSFKKSMYEMLEYVLYLEKINKKDNIFVLEILNRIDSKLNVQRIYLRIMKKNKWIDEKKFNVSIGLIYEIGKILGGMVKFYGKNN